MGAGRTYDPAERQPPGPRVKAEQTAFVRSLLSLVLVSYVLEREKHCFPFSSPFVWVCVKETDDAALLGEKAQTAAFKLPALHFKGF